MTPSAVGPSPVQQRARRIALAAAAWEEASDLGRFAAGCDLAGVVPGVGKREREELERRAGWYRELQVEALERLAKVERGEGVEA